MRYAMTFTGGVLTGGLLFFVIGRSPPERNLAVEYSCGTQNEPPGRKSGDQEERRSAHEKLAVAGQDGKPDPSFPYKASPPAEKGEVASQPKEVDLAALLAAVERRHGQKLALLLLEVLSRDKKGFPLLEDFLEAVASTPQGFSVFLEPQVALPLLRLVLDHEEQVAALAEYILSKDPSESRDKIVQHQTLGWLTAFLASDSERFPSVRQLLEEELAWMLEHPDRYLWRTLTTLHSLGLEPSEEALRDIISDPHRHAQHNMVIAYLVGQDTPEAVATLRGFIDESIRADRMKSWLATTALRGLARMEDPEAATALNEYLHSGDVSIREHAIVTYFSLKRDLDSLPLALDLLNYGENLSSKQSLLWNLKRKNLQIFEAIRSDPGAIADPEVLKTLKRSGVAPEEPELLESRSHTP